MCAVVSEFLQTRPGCSSSTPQWPHNSDSHGPGHLSEIPGKLNNAFVFV